MLTFHDQTKISVEITRKSDHEHKSYGHSINMHLEAVNPGSPKTESKMDKLAKTIGDLFQRNDTLP